MTNRRKRRNQGRFAGIPLSVMESDLYVQLNNLAKILLYELCGQYNGGNNGYLSLTRNQLKERGINSPEATKKAIENLISAGFITRTRQGGAAKGKAICSLYAINWQPIDEKRDKPLENYFTFKGAFGLWFKERSNKIPMLKR
ncbi:hypothetical protein [Vibrio quintilis]|uniref:Uncharacterized protein n=1 Tax=Vibrio quintilis TaxID=1117707 RepID=A0A1M7Z2R4_9VIBR|nr:hypothetical protein [Vibrio quintilis]SHO59080.1 hypothetical protein VQ7734_04856 [Vibrio quintilis]